MSPLSLEPKPSTASKPAAFAVDYCDFATNAIHRRVFKSAKAMEQWITRNENRFFILIFRRCVLINGVWDTLTTIGNRTITLTELRKIVLSLEKQIQEIDQMKVGFSS